MLKTNGKRIVNQNGYSIILKGYNLGAWLSRSYSMSAFVPLANSQEEFNKLDISCINNESFYQVLDKNPNVKSEQINELSNILYDSFITEDDWDIISQTGANVVRLPFEYSFFTILGDERAFEILDLAINNAKKRGIYVILDLHLVQGRQNSGGWCNDYTFFSNSNYRNNMVELWGKIAKRYKDEAGIAGFDLLNEPEGHTSVLLDFYNKAYKKIREYDKNHIIIMEENCLVCGHAGATQSNTIGSLPNPKDYGWSNVMYSVHDYVNTGYDTLPNVLMSRITSRLKLLEEKMNKYNIPYYIGEFSYLGSTDEKNNYNARFREYLCVWNCVIDKYEELGLSYTPWTYKANNEMFFGLVYYGTTKEKADIFNDDYNTLKTKFSNS